MKEIRVLIAEDQEIIRKSLRIVLGLAPDIEIVGTAENGKDAVNQVNALKPNLVLMDIHMPVMDGVEATVAIKAKWPEVKVIILTTFQDVQYVVGALNGGAEGYILKAIDPMDLAAAIRLVHRGETMITQEVAKALFARSLGSANLKESEYGLTERELQVLKYISDGMANRSIAERMYLSEGTVKNFISNIYSKLNVHNRASAMKKASDEGLF
ncbi:response regulator receiver protein [Paenibacillus riograndensis]|uniref:Response regulator receiver protein n=1 Tax=Paenibacillus riograndensis TaxID=483937 RepID=A0A132TPT6_9BACL|nr:response regulator transcription factor [Paenibacillus riograndensis]KWX73294.1 response regulator receiver protein [Paenibacillus riograndensis]KWX81806.1 response regulator receiver protein [Paenibacillus riograndensis]